MADITTITKEGAFDHDVRTQINENFASLESGGVTPAGNNFDVQFNNNTAAPGQFGANDAFNWNNDTLTLALGTGPSPATLDLTNASVVGFSGGSPGGSDGSIQYRVDGSTFGGFGSWDGTAATLPKVSVSGASAQASLVTNFGTADKNLTFTTNGLMDGEPGNLISISFTHSGTNSPLTVSLSGYAITVHLATNGGGTITSTASDVANASEFLSGPPSNLVSVSAVTTGAGVVPDMAETFLSGGVSPLTVTGLVSFAGGKAFANANGNFTVGSLDIFSATGVYGLALNPSALGDPTFYINPYPFGTDNGPVNLSIGAWSTGQVLFQSDTVLMTLAGVGTRHVCADTDGKLVVCP